jgi:hypothetical protein
MDVMRVRLLRWLGRKKIVSGVTRIGRCLWCSVGSGADTLVLSGVRDVVRIADGIGIQS